MLFSASSFPNGGNYEQALSSDEKKENVNDFFEHLFTSIDYSLLLIFLGTFIVVENLESTGIPHKTWSLIVGEQPFNSFSSVVGISLFVLIASQFLGNVAVVQLAMPNVAVLPDREKRYVNCKKTSIIYMIQTFKTLS